MSLNTLRDLFVDQLRDLYSAETQLLTALPKMEKAASNADLKKGFSAHLEETRSQVNRLEQVFSDLGVSPEGEHCAAMAGLIKESEEVMGKPGDPLVKDAALIAAAQRVEHYEIAGYGAVCTYAEHLGQKGAHQLLKETMAEEKETDHKLTKLAEGGWLSSGINQQAEKR